MTPITVQHTLGSYPVYVEPGALRALPSLVEELVPGRLIALISDENVAPLYQEWSAGTPLRTALILTFPAGERSKTRETWSALSDRMLAAGLGRDSAIVALGGGVVGDLAGFVAATYLRGIPYAQIPTTLLAMLDASVGGKVGVDTPHGKNLIGAFHPPSFVVADPLTLGSLPEREFRGGLAEAVKHGLIADADYFEWIEDHTAALARRDPEPLTHLIRRSVEIKAAVVGEDEREQGRRAILNAGHTVAHGLEQVSGYRLPHGEAVALGLVSECRIAEHLGIAPAGLSQRVQRLLAALGLPTRGAGSAGQAVVKAMGVDKKNRAGVIRCALPTGLGTMYRSGASWTVAVEPPVILEALAGLG